MLSQPKLVALVARLRGCLGSITPRQQETLLLRTGLNGRPAYTPGRVARILHVSDRHEAQIEQAAVAGLRSANAHTSCAAFSSPGSSVAEVATTSLTLLRQIFRPVASAAAHPLSKQVGMAGGHARRSQRRPPSATTVRPASSPPANSGVISPPHGGGTSWLLLAVAAGLLLAVGAAIAVRRRSQLAQGAWGATGVAAGGLGRWRVGSRPALLGWSTRAPSVRRAEFNRKWWPRWARLSALVGCLMPFALLTRPRTSQGSDGPSAPAVPEAGAPRRRTETPAADAPDPTSVFAEATALEGQHDLVGAERAYRRADVLGHPEAAFHLGGMHAERGDFQRAEASYRRADELGHAEGAFNHGVLLDHRNNRSGAEAAYRRADERGNALAAFNLGVLLEQRGDQTGAEAAYRRADERGDAAAAFSLGCLLAERGDLTHAEAAFRRGDERGDADAAFNLGGLLAERGDLSHAESAFRRADERGHVGAAFNLGVLLEERGDLAGAEAAYYRAEQRGHGEVAEMARVALFELRGHR